MNRQRNRQCGVQETFDTGCFFHWYPLKKLKYGKPRLGESTLTQIGLDTPNLAQINFFYLELLGGVPVKKNTLYISLPSKQRNLAQQEIQHSNAIGSISPFWLPPLRWTNVFFLLIHTFSADELCPIDVGLPSWKY